MSGMLTHLARFARALRERGVRVSLSDEVDAAAALALVDVTDLEEVRPALLTALKIRPADRAAFDELFDAVWLGRRAPPRPPARVLGAPALPRSGMWVDSGERVESTGDTSDGGTPAYSPDPLLRRKAFDALSPSEIAAMERLLDRLVVRLATERSRRYAPTTGRGLVDLRRSLRRTVATSGEPVSLARRARVREEPRFVVLCDTSGSMDAHTRFLLTFALALKRAARRVEVFAFNTTLTRLTPWLHPGKIAPTLKRLAAGVPDWAGGTRIGACLTQFVERHLSACVNARTVVVLLSDGLDRGDPAILARAMRAIRARARAVIWLNPLLGDPRYEPTARGMQAALPYVDRLASAHNLESLERLATFLAA